MNDFLPKITITGEQIKAARTMLRLNQQQFASFCHISIGLLRRMEKTLGPVSSSDAILKNILHSLENSGVEIVEAGYYEGYGGPGIRMKGEPTMSSDVINLSEVAEIKREQEVVKQEAS